jgi:hypothetical protein
VLPLGPLGGARLKLVGCSYTTSPWLPMRECMCVGCMDARMLRAMVLVRYMPRHICCALGMFNYKLLDEEDQKTRPPLKIHISLWGHSGVVDS